MNLMSSIFIGSQRVILHIYVIERKGFGYTLHYICVHIYVRVPQNEYIRMAHHGYIIIYKSLIIL